MFFVLFSHFTVNKLCDLHKMYKFIAKLYIKWYN